MTGRVPAFAGAHQDKWGYLVKGLEPFKASGQILDPGWADARRAEISEVGDMNVSGLEFLRPARRSIKLPRGITREANVDQDGVQTLRRRYGQIEPDSLVSEIVDRVHGATPMRTDILSTDRMFM